MDIGFDTAGRIIFTDDANASARDPSAPRPMLAYRVEKTGFPSAAICQPKIDGVRAVLTAGGLFTRYGRRITSCPHIVFDGGDSPLDGELYVHGAPLEAIAGAVRSIEPTDASLKLQFHVFDTLNDAPAIERQAILDRRSKTFPAELARVETIIATRRADIERHYRACLDRGYEGQMMREPSAAYAPRRCRALIKRKPFDDMECRIVSVTRKDGRAVAATMIEASGEIFNAFIRAGVAARLSRSGAIGGEATVRHWGRTRRGAPRHAVLYEIYQGGRST